MSRKQPEEKMTITETAVSARLTEENLARYPAAEITVKEAYGHTTFTGRKFAEVSTRTGDQPRWTELRLYWHGDAGYVLVKVGRSVLYHRLGNPCNAGEPRTVGDLFDELGEEAFNGLTWCRRCEPRELDDMEDDESVSAETDRNAVRACQDAETLISYLMFQPHQQSSDQPMSNPATRLLRIAAEIDPAIALILNAPRQL